jgi:hypothetical protein
MLRHSLMNENARALPVGALATYALRILNSTALTRSTISPEESAVVFTAAYRALKSRPATHLGRYSSKFSNVLSCWVPEYASGLEIGILNSISSAP